MFAHVLFASVVEIHGRHSYDPRVHCCAARLENRFDSIETSWEVGQDWAGIRGVLVPLVCVLSFPALSCGVPVLLPVVRMPLMPGALTAFLVFSIVRIVRHLLVLPTLSPRSLAGWHGAVNLVRYLRARYERLAAACAGPNSCHGVLPDETRGCFAVSPPFTGCLSCRSVKPDRWGNSSARKCQGFRERPTIPTRVVTAALLASPDKSGQQRCERLSYSDVPPPCCWSENSVRELVFLESKSPFRAVGHPAPFNWQNGSPGVSGF